MAFKVFDKLGSIFSSASKREPTWAESHKAFFKAIKKGDIEAIEATVKKYPDAVKWDKSDGGVLFTAMNAGQLKAFERLIDLGADLDMKARRGSGIFRDSYPVLEFAARKRGKEEYVRVLLERGAKQTYYAFLLTSMVEFHAYTSARTPELKDYMKRADIIRAEYLAKHPLPAHSEVAAAGTPPAATPAPKQALKL